MNSKMHALMLGFALTLPLALAGCGDDKDKPKSGGGGDKTADQKADDAPKAGGGAAYDKAKGTASVKITVKWAGAAQTDSFYSMTSSDTCATHNGKVRKELNEVTAAGTVPHCFVWATSGPATEASGFDKSAKPVMTQSSCTYEPHVLGVMVDQAFSVKNGDTTSHNVHGKPTKNKNEPNISQAAGKSDDITFKKAEEAIPLVCDVHSWMNAYVFVTKHPFAGGTDRASGSVTISGLYPGKYTFKVWHENWAKTGSEKTVEIDVKDGANEASVEMGK